ncbi:nuclear transport factor 2 family protein [Denitratisoma oestradiolicum]|uniref:Polyketide cyclase n=1 Tax=Denitratisoma oestradiolicum TaxID=311182 RepID=A0A6S6YIQ8_9PROT|nr:nuclear transport factor 2 family protein [Denitratisoma oestradiolicum]TWO80554.1 polyketide cyclase [Denitratisoma oestradiolicum]CAB1367624.1 Polyketide cyclase [Denitratisoma oestradiolicum]
MGRFTEAELRAAFDIYNDARRRSQETGDWNIWANIFTEDAHYIEHAYGEMHGREEIRKWICDVMKPYPHMRFPQSWKVFDTETDAIVFCCLNTFPMDDPKDNRFQFPNWCRVVYAGNGLFSSEEDIYNPFRDASKMAVDWLKAGGKMLAEPIPMKHVPRK